MSRRSRIHIKRVLPSRPGARIRDTVVIDGDSNYSDIYEWDGFNWWNIYNESKLDHLTVWGVMDLIYRDEWELLNDK